MDVRVRFRFNKLTGEVEIFDVEDEGGGRLPDAEHNREHDRIARGLGGLLDRNPRLFELLPGTGAEPLPEPNNDEERSEDKEDRRERGSNR